MKHTSQFAPLAAEGLWPCKQPTARVFGMLTSFAVLKRVGELYLLGWPKNHIARELNLNIGTVSTFILRAGLTRLAEVKPSSGGSWQFIPNKIGSYK